ncbi:MAG: Ger(x)C family spore germination C-terminal domain-containing protein [Clostridia bacterium]|nr:Ger(x)C family spore germination C-terminal domain-containing protein [Clostridia bacterium]
MIKKLKNLIKKPIIIVLIIISIFYLPKGLAAPPEGLERLHATSIGIDIAEDGGYEITVLAFVAFQSQQFREGYFIVTSKSDSLATAIDKIGSLAGKKIALTHTSVIVFSEELAQKGLIEPLDYFFRDKNLGGDTHIAITDGKAKDTLILEQSAIDKVGIRIDELNSFNNKFNYFVDTNLESFYRGYFSPTKTSLVGMIKQNPEVLAKLKEGSNASSPTEQGGGQQENFIKAESNLGVFFEGKMVYVLNDNEIRGSNWINGKTTQKNLKIDNVTDRYFDNASVIFNTEKNIVDKTAYFVGERPIIEFNILLGLKLDEVLQENIEQKNFSTNADYLSDVVKQKIENKVKQEFAEVLKKMIEYKTDIFGIYVTFSEQQHFQFLDWYNNLENPEDFLSLIEYRMSVKSVIAY